MMPRTMILQLVAARARVAASWTCERLHGEMRSHVTDKMRAFDECTAAFRADVRANLKMHGASVTRQLTALRS